MKQFLNGILIATYLAGAMSAGAAAIETPRCRDDFVPATIMRVVLWPVALTARVAVAVFDPQVAMRPCMFNREGQSK